MRDIQQGMQGIKLVKTSSGKTIKVQRPSALSFIDPPTPVPPRKFPKTTPLLTN